MTERIGQQNNGLLNDGDSLSYENMIKDWEEAVKFEDEGYNDLAFTLKDNFFNKLALIKDLELIKKIDVIIHPWKAKR